MFSGPVVIPGAVAYHTLKTSGLAFLCQLRRRNKVVGAAGPHRKGLGSSERCVGGQLSQAELLQLCLHHHCAASRQPGTPSFAALGVGSGTQGDPIIHHWPPLWATLYWGPQVPLRANL